MAEGRAGGVGGGFDGNPAGPSRDGANDDHDPSDRNKRRRGRMKLPSEYADFKLADGRSLREVMGDKFFGAAGAGGDGKFMSKGVRERLRKGGSPAFAGKFKKVDPDRLAALKARLTNAGLVRGTSPQAVAEARQAEQQARREERRARHEARRAAHPGGNFTFGGGV